MRSRRALVLFLLFTVVLPASGAGPHLEPGTLVADGSPDQAVQVLLYVQGGYGDARSVYVVRPVARGTACDRLVDGTLDPFGPVTFPPFGSPSATQATDSGSPDDWVDRLVNESFRPSATGA